MPPISPAPLPPCYSSRLPIRPRHRLEKDDLLTCLTLLRENAAFLENLRKQIVRRGVAPAGWENVFASLLLEARCAISILEEQIDAFWPDEP